MPNLAIARESSRESGFQALRDWSGMYSESGLIKKQYESYHTTIGSPSQFTVPEEMAGISIPNKYAVIAETTSELFTDSLRCLAASPPAPLATWPQPPLLLPPLENAWRRSGDLAVAPRRAHRSPGDRAPPGRGRQARGSLGEVGPGGSPPESTCGRLPPPAIARCTPVLSLRLLKSPTSEDRHPMIRTGIIPHDQIVLQGI
jgi:hypothetical protein